LQRERRAFFHDSQFPVCHQTDLVPHLLRGQYNEDWKYIHTMPQYLGQVARDLNAEKILTVHHSKYALARHRWDEPLKNAMNLKEKDSLNVLMPIIGEVVRLK
jgi:L-ascorbate metabolism protein UlaG (beta-lactamase superfamily)